MTAAESRPADGGRSSVVLYTHSLLEPSMTFIVSHNGKVYERDLGKNTGKVAPAIKSFDPGKGWNVVKPE
jgi:hypothetical protein